MARLFDDASTEYLEIDSAIVSAEPFTLACWFRSDDITAHQRLVTIGDISSGSNYFALILRGDDVGDPLWAISRASSSNAIAETAAGFLVDTWHHACGVFASTASRSAYIDGGSKATNTDSRTGQTVDRTTIGANAFNHSQPMSGRIAEVGVWDAALTDAEVASLAAGFSPLLIRPGNLVSYWPLGGIYNDGNAGNVAGSDYDIVGGLNLSPTNTPSTGAHPPGIIYPTVAQMSFVVGAPAPSGIITGRHYPRGVMRGEMRGVA